jgi:DNA-binding HxlR family transcriptional regulator
MDLTTDTCVPTSRTTCGYALAEALQSLEGRWKMLILAHLLFSGSAMRLSELKRQIPEISQKMLIQQLRALEEAGIASRTVYPQVPPKVEYALTELGVALGPVFKALLEWADIRQVTPNQVKPTRSKKAS